MEEIWKDIEGYPNYQVSNLGRIKKINYKHIDKEKILKPYNTKRGYLHIDLFKENSRKVFKVHRLVASAFIPNQNNLPQVNHKDENKTNNKVENLEWCDNKYNLNYGMHNERVAKSKSIPILQFTLDGEFVKRWESTIQVERELGFNNSNICSCIKGRYKTAGGYVWGYADDYERIPFKVFDLEMYRKKAA